LLHDAENEASWGEVEENNSFTTPTRKYTSSRLHPDTKTALGNLSLGAKELGFKAADSQTILTQAKLGVPARTLTDWERTGNEE